MFHQIVLPNCLLVILSVYINEVWGGFMGLEGLTHPLLPYYNKLGNIVKTVIKAPTLVQSCTNVPPCYCSVRAFFWAFPPPRIFSKQSCSY